MDAAGVKMTHVPYKGMAPAVTDVVGGHVDVLIASAPSIQQHVKSGKVRGLGVTSAGPSAVVPELPSVQQQGVKGYSFELWWGVLAPAGTPPEIVTGINAELNKILAAPDVKEVFLREGAESAPTTPAQFTAIIRDEIAKWKQVAQKAGITAE
jgi:tripartite-type tricarboxylate transporter receptor subunit TctC